MRKSHQDKYPARMVLPDTDRWVWVSVRRGDGKSFECKARLEKGGWRFGLDVLDWWEEDTVSKL